MSDDSPVAAWSLPSFAPRDLLQVGGGVAHAAAPAAWITMGAVLDVAGFVPLPGGVRHLRIASLGGLAALEAVEPDELALLDLLRRRRGRVGAGELLCESGVVLLYRSVCRLRGIPAQRLACEQVVAKAAAARCPECSRSVAIFCAVLGDVVADAALALGARGGVYLGGALVGALGDGFLRSPFRRRFEGRGRGRDLLRAIPTFVVRSAAAPSPAGLARVSSRTNSLN